MPTIRTQDNTLRSFSKTRRKYYSESKNTWTYNFDARYLFYYFLVFDAFLFLYRCCRAYGWIRVLLHGSDEEVRVGLEQTEIKSQRVNSNDAMFHGTLNSKALEAEGGTLPLPNDDPDLPPGSTDYEAETTELRPTPLTPDDGVHRDIVLRQNIKDSPKSFVIFFKNLCQASVWPKVLFAFIISLIVVLLVVTTERVLTVELIDSYNGFEKYAVAMDINQNLTNKYVKKQAEQLNDMDIGTYRLQMDQDLKGLLSLRENFNMEQVSIKIERTFYS